MSREVTLAYIVRAGFQPSETTFVTPSDSNLQLGFVVYPKGGDIPRHFHQPIERTTVGTMEALVLKEGACEVDIYDSENDLVATRRLNRGDTLLLLGGGHGFRMLDDTVLLEIKQGPYTGLDEKKHF